MSVCERRFRGGPAAAKRARRAVRESLGAELSERTLGDVELLVSELATNSVRHAGCSEQDELAMEADVSEDRVRGRLFDRGRGFASESVPRRPSQEGSGGYGLVLLDRLADR